MGKLIRNSNSQHSTPPINNSNPTMKSVIVLLVLVAVSQIDAFPRAIFYPGFRPGGNGAGFGTGNAGPFGSSATGVELLRRTMAGPHLELETVLDLRVLSDTTPVERETVSRLEDKYRSSLRV